MTILSMLDRFEQAAAKADRDELHAARRAIMEAFDQAQKAIEALNICIEQDDKREAKLREREAELVKALSGLLSVVDKMDLPPCAGGGVLPVDKALATHAARAAIHPSLEQE